MNPLREYYKVWKIFAAEMDFYDFGKNGPKTEETYTYFTNFVKQHVEKAINGKSPYLKGINEDDNRELPDNWWEVAIGIYNGKKVIPNVEPEEESEYGDEPKSEDEKSVSSDHEKSNEIEEEETPAQILRQIAGGSAEETYDALLPVYTALRENYDSRFKLFSWIFDHARYTAERDSMKALSGMIQALTGDSKEELDRRYREFKAQVKLTPDQKKKLNEKVKIDKLKITNPEKAERLIAKQTMLDEQKKLAEQNEVDEYGQKINYSNFPQEVDSDDDDSEIDEEENYQDKENSLNENREQIKDEQFIKDVAVNDNENDVSDKINDEESELNRSEISRSN